MKKFKFFRVSTLIILFLLWDSYYQAAQTEPFSSIIENLPLINGFTEDLENVVVFETPMGRIIEISAIGKGNLQDAIDFYQKSLPQLGWDTRTETQYHKNGEMLKIDVKDKNDHESTIQIFFKITPQGFIK